MPAFEGGAAQPVTVDTTGGKRRAGAAIPVYVASGGPRIAGPARRVVVVTSGPVEGRAAVPVYEVASGGALLDGPAVPVYVVQGVLGAAAVDPAMAYTNKVKALNPIVYWPLAEASGTTIINEEGTAARNGTYTAVTLGAAGIGDGRTSASFDGSTSKANIHTASLGSAFNGQEGTIALWVKMSAAGVWTDGMTRVWVRLLVNASNFLDLRKTNANNTLDWRYGAGGTVKTITKASVSSTGFLHIALTWSKAADQVKAYFNGVQEGATQTGLGTFAGSLDSTQTMIGAASTVPANVASGSIAHVALWTTPLSAAQILSLATV